MLLFDEDFGGKGLIGRNGGGSGWHNQSGIGTTVQGPKQCAPTAAANALAGLNNSGLYPAESVQNGNDVNNKIAVNTACGGTGNQSFGAGSNLTGATIVNLSDNRGSSAVCAKAEYTW